MSNLIQLLLRLSIIMSLLACGNVLANDKAVSHYLKGQQYRLGNGVNIDLGKAAEHYQIAAEEGHVKSQRQLGALYYRGNNADPDYEKAWQWLKPAAAAGDDWAQWIVGVMYLNGEGVEADEDLARTWLQKSSQQGNAEAVVALKGLEGKTFELKDLSAQPSKAAGADDDNAPKVDLSQLDISNPEQYLPEDQASAVSANTSRTAAGFAVQTGIYSIKDNASDEAQKVRQAMQSLLREYPVELRDISKPGRILYQTRISGFADFEEAQGLCQQLKQYDIQCYAYRLK